MSKTVRRVLVWDEWYPVMELENREPYASEWPYQAVTIPAEMAERHDRILAEFRAMQDELDELLIAQRKAWEAANPERVAAAEKLAREREEDDRRNGRL